MAGALHVAVELTLSLAVSRSYNALVCLLFLAYVGWRVRADPTLPRAWGLRRDNLRPGSLAFGVLIALAAPVIYAIGAIQDVEPQLSVSALALYLAWGLAQQFALQNLLAANLRVVLASPWLSAVLSAIVFGSSHVPRLDLAGIACMAGVAFVPLYRRFPNLFAAGVAHGVLGWLVFGLWGWK